MTWLVLALLLVTLLAGLFAARQSYLLLVGRTARLSKQVNHLPPEGRAVASRHYGYLCAGAAIGMLVLFVTVVLYRLPFNVWSQVLTIVSGCAVVWAWFLNRRYGKPDA